MAIQLPYREARTRDSTPFILTTGPQPLVVTVPAATGIPSPPVTLPTLDLINTLRAPVEITELHFLISETGRDDHPFHISPGFWGGGWEISLAVGSHRITREFCPLSALAIRRDTDFFEGLVATVAGFFSPVLSSQVRWILPVPLILAPNEGFSGMVRLSPNLTPFPLAAVGAIDQTVTLVMVARGRRLAAGTPVPRVRAIPYASGWIFTQTGPPGSDMTYQNLFATDLNVSSLNAVQVLWSPGNTNQAYVVSGTILIDGPGGLSNTVLRSVIAPTGQVPALMRTVFAERGALEEAHVLNPGEAYQINVAPVRPDLNSGIAVNLIGWREE